ncbi:MAG: ccoP2 [Candidatus Solibacter sp.]|nr:ccoP2 [Candidatus Solibacter sp.]
MKFLTAVVRNRLLFCSITLCAGALFLGGALASPKLRAAYHKIRNSSDLTAGKSLFLANCAMCHGMEAGGGRGPALVGREFLHGSSDDELLAVIREGIPGSSMPAFAGTDEEERNIVVYIRSLSSPIVGGNAHPTGDAERGKRVYSGLGCAGCHLIDDAGSVFGPNLTRVGAGRSYEFLKQSLLNPSADITPGGDGVTVTTVDGRRVTGIRINEDSFTLQLRDQSQKFITFDKSEIRQVTHEKKSLMPTYSSLPPRDLEDLLAYLSTLRGVVKGGTGTAIRQLR